MRASVYCILFVFAIGFIKAQTVSQGLDEQTNIDALGQDNLNGIVRKYDNRYEGIRGTPYLFHSWNNGSLLLTNGKSFNNIPVKIDLYVNEVIVKRSSGDSIIIKSNTIDKVTIMDALSSRVHTFKKWSDLGVSKAGYADVLYEGKYILLAERKKNLIKANYEGVYSAHRPFDELVDEVTYLVKKDQQTPEKIRLTRKAVLEIFPDHQSELKSFIRKEQIDFRNVDQVVKIFRFYDSL